jgi:hypothetical protein
MNAVLQLPSGSKPRGAPASAHTQAQNVLLIMPVQRTTACNTEVTMRVNKNSTTIKENERQCTYNVTPRHVHITIIAMEKQ